MSLDTEARYLGKISIIYVTPKNAVGRRTQANTPALKAGDIVTTTPVAPDKK